MFTKEGIEDLYSRVPVVRPPKVIYYLKGAYVEADRLYDATHSYNAALQQAAYTVYGMQVWDTPYIMVAGNAPPTTPLHEAIHYSGVKNEAMTRRLTAFLMARSNLNLGLRRRQVHYMETPVDPAMRERILHDLHLSNPSGENFDLVRLEYVPP